MIGAWPVNVSGRIFGPYTSERMRAFAEEGRLAPHSLVTREGASDWHEARDEPEFAEFFPRQAAKTAPLVPITPALTAAVSPPPSDLAEGAKAHFAVVVDIKSRSPGNLEQAIMSFCPAYKLLPNVWIVSTEQTVNAVRNRLVQELGKLDSLFVVDATRGKAAWFNFGPEADVRIRRVWQKAS
jgi:hypothetical protein